MKIIVLDRDGVINQDSDAYIKSADEWLPEPGAIDAIVKLKQAGWTVAIATNQSGLNRGFYNRATLSQMHAKLQAMLVQKGGQACQVDWINFSPYLAGEGSHCRKPATGMLSAIEKRFNCSLHGAPMIGDTLNDVRVAQAKGLVPLFVKTGKGQRTLDKSLHDTNTLSALTGVAVFKNLLTAVESIL